MKPIHLFDEARELAMQYAIATRSRKILIEQAHGTILAEDVYANIDVPPFTRSMMDGYAIQSADVDENGGTLQIIGSQAAGDPPTYCVAAGQAVRIMTGAAVPDGADAIARFEWCREQPDRHHVQVLRTISTGESVQRQGEDGTKGQLLLRMGSRLTGIELAICRTFGVHTVEVTVPPRVAILITGSELAPNAICPLEPGQIYGANDLFLRGALVDDGIVEIDVTYIRDDFSALSAAIDVQTRAHEFVIITGGVSAGDFDFVPQVLRDLGAQLEIEKILMRPGSPFVLSRNQNATVFALSGNPAACFVQFETIVRPAIRRSLGMPDDGFSSTGTLLSDLNLKEIKHTRILRGKAQIHEGKLMVDTRTSQSPGVMSGFTQTNCLIRLDESEYAAGAILPIRWLKQPI